MPLLSLICEFGIKKALKKLVTWLIICTFIGDNKQVTNKVKAMITNFLSAFFIPNSHRIYEPHG